MVWEGFLHGFLLALLVTMEDVKQARVSSPVQRTSHVLHWSSVLQPLIADGAGADPGLVSNIAEQLRKVSVKQGHDPSVFTDIDVLIEHAALQAFAVRHAVGSPCHAPPSSCSAPDTPLQEACRKLLSAAEACILYVTDVHCHRRLSLALVRSHALHGFSRLIATDVELLQRAQKQLETEQKQQTTQLLHRPCQLATQGAATSPATISPVFVFGATAQSPSPTGPSDKAPINTTSPPLFLPSYPWVKRQRVRLYHSLEEAARMVRWIYHGMMLASGTSKACGCQLCRTSLDRHIAAAGRPTCSHDPEGQQPAGSSGRAAGGNGSAGPGADSGGCLLVEVWKALHESALLEHLVLGSLALYGNPHAWDTDSCGSGSTGSCCGGGQATGGASARASGPLGRDSREQLAAAERALLASRMRLEQEAQLEYQMRAGGSALQVVLHQLPGGLMAPAADHPAYPHIQACGSRVPTGAECCAGGGGVRGGRWAVARPAVQRAGGGVRRVAPGCDGGGGRAAGAEQDRGCLAEGASEQHGFAAVQQGAGVDWPRARSLGGDDDRPHVAAGAHARAWVCGGCVQAAGAGVSCCLGRGGRAARGCVGGRRRAWERDGGGGGRLALAAGYGVSSRSGAAGAAGVALCGADRDL